MNYIIEENINLYDEIKLCENCDNENICLLTKLPLENNYITLNCNHKFNYKALYDETYNQKKYNILDVAPSQINEMKCPYCRTTTPNILPYFKIYDVKEIKGITMPAKYSLKIYNCEYVWKSGKSKGCKCNNSAFISDNGIFCNTHYKKLPNKNIVLYNNEDEKFYNKYNIPKLKEILRANKCKVGGRKKELINRICSEKLLKSTGWLDIL